MEPPSQLPELRKLLDTCAALQTLRSRIADPEIDRDARTRLRRQTKRKTEQLTRKLKGYHFRGPLAEVVQTFPLTPDEFQILAVLLQRQTHCDDPAQEGRLILAAVFESAYEILARIDLLQPEAPLRASGLLVVEDEEEHPESVLEARFVLSEECLAGLRAEILGHPSAANRVAPPTDGAERRAALTGAYGNNRDLLIDLRILHNLYAARSERLFHEDRWNRLRNSGYRPTRTIDQRIGAAWQDVRARLEATPSAASFPAVRLMREYGLGEEEVMVVVHLLFRELFEGNAYADVADLLRLISQNESELIRNRRLFGEQGSLRKAEILCIEPMLEKRALTGEAHLADWVVNYLFGSTAPDSTIAADERIDFHTYLADLDDSKGFFQDLDAN